MKLKGKLLTTGLVVGGVIGTLGVVNKLTESMAGELNTVLTGEERRYPWKYGDMSMRSKVAMPDLYCSFMALALAPPHMNGAKILMRWHSNSAFSPLICLALDFRPPGD